MAHVWYINNCSPAFVRILPRIGPARLSKKAFTSEMKS